MRVGFSRVEISVHEPSMSLLGWGRGDQQAERVAAPMYARAGVFEQRGRTFAFVVMDLCFVSAALRVGVLEELEARGAALRPADVWLTATHTHAGPSGYSDAFFYDLAAPGFSPRVYERLVRGAADAITQALAAARPATLRLSRAPIGPRAPVAFNRSLDAHRRNVRRPGDGELARDGVDRDVYALAARDGAGALLGAVFVHPLHATSLHADAGARLRRAVHPDHPGLACDAIERAVGEPGFVALFAQGAAGDATPNHRLDRARGVDVGVFDDDLASAQFVADTRARAAVAALQEGLVDGVSIDAPFASSLARADFELRPVPAQHSGTADARTTLGALGLAMARGTREGPGPLAAVPHAVAWAKGRGDDPKRALLEIGPHRPRRLLGRLDPRAMALPHPAFARARAMEAAGALEGLPWIPTILPVALWRLGPLALVGLPNEPTLVAGRRIAAVARQALGVEHALVIGYTNAYSGYLTTPEEYRAQRYEGAYTLFGPHTLAAYAAEVEALAGRLDADDGRDRGPALQVCSPAQRAARSEA